MSGDFERVPPHNRKAEEIALGGMLLSRAAIADVDEVIRAADHLVPAHQVIHEAIMRLDSRGEPADAVAVAAELARTKELGKVGGAPYLHTLIAAVPSAANAGYYARLVHETAVARRIAGAGLTIEQIAYAADLDAAERAERAYQVLDEAAGKAVPPKARSVADLIDPAIERIEKGPESAAGVTTGWGDLDDLILGFQPGEVVTVGARPGQGKSVVMLNAAAHAALRLGLPVLVCSLEMSEQECLERIISAEGSVDLRRLRSADLDETDWSRIAKVRERVVGSPHLMLNTDPYLTVQGIRSDLRTMRRAGNPAALVVVDYLQLMTSGGKTENRQAEVSQISRGIKLLAKEFEVPVMVGSQLNRGPEMRSDHKPLMADLRESGSVEQDSSIVILLFREDAYERESPRAGEIDLIVAKNRQGPQATVTLAFQGHYARCADMYKPWTPSAALGSAA